MTGPRWCWASMISRCARGMSTAPSWSTSRPAGRSTCCRSGPRNPSAPGWMPTRAWRSSAGTAAAATPKARPQGAPLAIQVADRWHLWHNLAEAVERAVGRHRSCLQDPPPDPEPGPPAEQAAPAPETGLAARTRARHAEVHAALARGLTLTEISRTLRLDRKTVRRYATAATADQLTGGARLTRPGLLGPHQDWLRQRWDEGIRSTERLHAGTARPRLPRQPAHPAPAHRPAPPRHRRPRAPSGAAGQEGGQLDPHPARRPHRRRPRRARADHRPLRGTRQPPATWSASSPTCSATAAASAWKPGPAKPRPARSASCAASPKGSAATGPPSPPGSPSPTAPAPSKATSTASFCGIRFVKSRGLGPAGRR